MCRPIAHDAGSGTARRITKGPQTEVPVWRRSGGDSKAQKEAPDLLQGSNVLILDSLTKDLDVETLRALGNALADFADCGVVIFQARFFLDRTCTCMLAFKDNAAVAWFEGKFEANEADKIRRLGRNAVEPKRTQYRTFAR